MSMSDYKFVEKEAKDLRHLVYSSAELYGDKARFTYKHKRETFTYTYNDLLSDMNALGTGLIKLGLGGKTVAIIGDTHPSYITTYFAVVNGNGTIVPLAKELKDDEIANFLNFTQADAIVYTADIFEEKLASIKESVPDVKYFIGVYTENKVDDEKFITYDSVIDLGKKALSEGFNDYLDVEIDMEKCCAILMTSGTMGTSKGVMLNQRNLTAATNSSCRTMEFMDCNTRLISVLPVHHTYEMTTGQLAATNKGMTTFINDSIKHFMKNTADVKPTVLVLVPLFVETMVKRIWASIEAKGLTDKVKKAIKISNAARKIGIDLRKKLFKDVLAAFGGELKYIVCGGAVLDDAIIRDLDAFGITVLNGYGITECSPLVSVNTEKKMRKGSIGVPVPGCQVKIDLTDGLDVGEILVKGDNVMMGYLKNPEATAEVFTEDGWFRTGDVGYMDKDGFIFITGRKKNIIILSNGKNIYPEEIETYISHIPLVNECVVVGRRNDIGEVVITALVYPNPEMTEGKDKSEVYALIKAEINEMNKDLPIFKQVREIEIRDEEFEKNTSHKIKRFKVQ